jgi:hypothetical protein
MKTRKTDTGQQQSLAEVSDEATSPPLPFDLVAPKLNGQDNNGAATAAVPGPVPEPVPESEPTASSLTTDQDFAELENVDLDRDNDVSIFADLDALKIEPDDEDDTSEEVLTVIPVRRPGKRGFQAYPSDEYQFEAYILEDTDTKTTTYVPPHLGKVLKAEDVEVKRVILALCINRANVMFYWPIPAEGSFRDSGLLALKKARTEWYKAIGDLKAGGFRTRKMLDDWGPPIWPDPMPSKRETLELTFHGNIARTLDHPAIKAARER